ncbi:histidine kinase dimerization/phosphoacceptor domain -containing protein [Neolewinella antarctica]|uniref:histidine kinase n=1 Tax=Neolewinella antarctica TaxID=442734 RepID=A0ABX0XFH5_9BACT|nr:histidine kinase dimerization/phosphoacceptor domain -containing protein [Neolewinella antarctica]NJC28073.1 two-component sensor histidine kinase [Neolewinella antarctica]
MTTANYFTDNYHRYRAFLLLLLFVAGCQTPSGPNPQDANARGGICELENFSWNYRLVNHVEILPDTAGRLTFADVGQPSLPTGFRPYRDFTEPLATHLWYWGKIQVVNQVPQAAEHLEWVLYFATDWTSLEVFSRDHKGNWRAERAGAFLPSNQKRFSPTAWGSLIRLNLPPGEMTTVYFRGKSERKANPPSCHIYLQTTDRFYGRMGYARVTNAVFIGFLGMMLLYNLIVYFFGRNRSYVYYSGYLLMMVIYAIQSNDDLTDLFGSYLFAAAPQNYGYFKSAIFVGLMSYLAFIRSFTNINVLLPGWGRYFRLLTWLGLPLLIFHLWVSYNSNFSFVLEDRISTPYIILTFVSCIALLYPLYRTEDRKGYFVIAGIAVISIGALISALSRVAFPPFSIFYLKLGVVAEVLIFSLGLAYEQKKQIQAKERADFALRESVLLREKDALEADRLREDNRKNALLAERNQENELLLKEIHHRVKNNLEVVSSLLELQSVGLTDEGARNAMLAGRSRVSTMGILHQKLYQGDNLGTVGMREYLTDLTKNLGHTFGVNGQITFRIDVPEELRLDIDTAVPLGLIANELITNSIKYAFSSAAALDGGGVPVALGAGTVDVEMSRVGERWLLAVGDNGSGKMVETVGGTGFGTRLVGMLVQQLEGELREVNDGGLRTEVSFRVGRVDASGNETHAPENQTPPLGKPGGF